MDTVSMCMDIRRWKLPAESDSLTKAWFVRMIAAPDVTAVT